MSEAEPTNHELDRRLRSIESKLDSVLTTKEAFQAEQRYRDKVALDQDRRIGEIEGTVTWAIRAIIGAFLGLIAQFVYLALE